jgi:pseudouridine kinase
MGGLLVIGGAHIDRIARLAAPHRLHTSNPAIIREAPGGGGFNAARAARRFGVAVAMLSARGGDAAGDRVAEAIATAGITDLAGVHLDHATPSYTAILEPDGELVTAIADMGLHETGIARSLARGPVRAAAAAADALLCDANLSPAALQRIAGDPAGTGKPLHALAISSAKVVRLAPLAARFDTVFFNRHEAAALSGLNADEPAARLASALAALGFRSASVTAGGAPAALLHLGTVSTIGPPQLAIADVTGAGDALAGTTIACMIEGMDLPEALRRGHAAAALTASMEGPFPDFTRDAVERLAQSIAPSTRWNPT